MMTSSIRAPSRSRLLFVLLATTVIVPALAVVVGTRADRFVFVLYREPKLAAFQALGWAFLIALSWIERPWSGRRSYQDWPREPPLIFAGLWIAYAALTGLWVRVEENYVYELSQYVFLGILLLALRLWGDTEPRVRSLLIGSLVASFVPITVLGLIQWRFDIPFLLPIDPDLGVRNPSLMGYKNPMALALIAQIFLIAYLALATSGRIRKIGLAIVLVLELTYLILLQSRSAYLALAVTAPCLVVVWAWQVRDPRRLRRLAVTSGLVVALVLGLLAAIPASRERLGSIADYLKEDVFSLEGDRITYLLNTLGMVDHHPFGVGLGDWQTHYPVYRSHNRYVSFTEEIQVRRAHSDYVQFLGELGWQGLALWLGLLASSLVFAIRRMRTTGDRLYLFLAAQLLVVAVASTGDYFVEIPYCKFQLFLLLAILVQPSAGAASPREQTGSRWPAILVTLLGIASVLYSADSLRRSCHAAALSDLAAEISTARAAGTPVERLADRFELAAFHGERFRAGFGHDKTFHKSYLVLVNLAWMQADGDRAITDAVETMSLHPYYPNGFKMLAELLRPIDPRLAAHYEEAYRYVVHEAEAGFRRPYPPLPEEPAGMGSPVR